MTIFYLLLYIIAFAGFFAAACAVEWLWNQYEARRRDRKFRRWQQKDWR